MKKLLLPLCLIIFIPIIPFSDATVDFSNKQLVSDNNAIVLHFGENTIQTSFSRIKTTPNLEFGIIDLVDQTILLDASDRISVRVLGNSIVIKSFDQNVFLYARNIGNSDFSINVLTLDRRAFFKQSFLATLESITKEIQTEQSEEINQDVMITVGNPIRTEVKDTYTLTIRVYDPKMNPNADIQRQAGYLEGVLVNVEMFDPLGNVFKTLSGETDSKGYFTFSHKIIENTDRLGKYTFTITANDQVYEGSTFFIEESDGGASNP